MDVEAEIKRLDRLIGQAIKLLEKSQEFNQKHQDRIIKLEDQIKRLCDQLAFRDFDITLEKVS